MFDKPCILVGVPVWKGAGRRGCDLGPSALSAAGVATKLAATGRTVVEGGNLAAGVTRAALSATPRIKALADVVAWSEAVAAAAYRASGEGIPVFLGGDHSLSIGSLAGLSRRATEMGRPLFILWLDAHPDLHTLATTISGNLHGTPLAYALDLGDFGGAFPPMVRRVDAADVMMLGIRSVDPAEDEALRRVGIETIGIDALERGVGMLGLTRFLDRVAAANGWLHVSLDADFLDPAIAPGVGTPVPGGATAALAHEVMTVLRRSGLVRSVDVAELNPLLDTDGATARLLVDLTAGLLAVGECDWKPEMGSCPQGSISYPS